MARHAAKLINTGCWDPQLWIFPSTGITWCLAGRTLISLDSMKGVPAKTSTSRFSTTRPSKGKSMALTDKREACQRPGEMSHLLVGWIGNWVTPGSQDVGRPCDESVVPLLIATSTGWCE